MIESAQVVGKASVVASLDDKLRLAESEVLTLDQIDTPVTYNTYAIDYFAQIYTRD